MKLIVWLVAFACSAQVAFAASYEEQLMQLSESVSSAVSKAGRKKVCVIDFTDLNGRTSDLGKFLAEELSVSLVITGSGFSVVDRSNLKRILAEHKLTSDGLINPANAQKLGLFSGVDAILLGNITVLEDSFVISVKVISTETAEIVAATRARLDKTAETTRFLGRADGRATEAGAAAAGSLTSSAKKYAQKIGQLNFEVLSLRSHPTGGAAVNVLLTNTGGYSLSVGLNGYRKKNGADLAGARLSDSRGTPVNADSANGIAFQEASYGASGIEAVQINVKQKRFSRIQLTDIGPGQSRNITLQFPMSPGAEGSVEYTVDAELIVVQKAGDQQYGSPTLQTYRVAGISPE